MEFLGGVTNSREVPIQNEREPTAKSKSESLTNYMLAKDREKKQAKPTQRCGFAELIAFALNLAKDIEQYEPLTYVGAMKSSQKREWMQAMVEEIQSLESNQTWELVDRPRNNWVQKERILGVEPTRFKVRQVAKGFTHKERVDYTEVFSSVVKHASIRVILSMVAQQELELE